MTAEWFEDPQATRRKMAGDPHRPAFHFLPPRNWMNDPNGLVYWQARYHLFYQFNPYHAQWGFIHWGHASSSDLVHWEDHPIALAPEQGTGDANGCWSGCVVIDQEVPTAVYTGFVDPQDTPILLARAQDPDLLTWKKCPHNPVITGAPAGVNRTDFRDPYVWHESEGWKMVVGAGMENGSSAVLLYRSEDLIDWEYLGPLFTGRSLAGVKMWECPNFFPLDDRYVLVVSLFPGILGVYYYVGDYDGRRFTPRQEGYLTESPFFYAPQVRCLDDDRTILFGWLLEGRDDATLEKAGWSGVQSLPHELRLDEDGRLASRPIAQVRALRRAERHQAELILEKGERYALPLQGRQLEIELTLEASSGGLAFDILAAPGGPERTTLRLMPGAGRLELDLSASSKSSDVKKPILTTELPASTFGTRTLRVFIDGSVVEAWVDERCALTGRAYPTDDMAAGLFLSSLGDTARIRDLRIWQLDAIWPAGEAA